MRLDAKKIRRIFDLIEEGRLALIEEDKNLKLNHISRGLVVTSEEGLKYTVLGFKNKDGNRVIGLSFIDKNRKKQIKNMEEEEFIKTFKKNIKKKKEDEEVVTDD